MKNLGIILCLLISITFIHAQQDHSHEFGRKIVFPNIPGYQTLKCDFHIHTVFSDGSVWPDIRVQEAIRDGMDAISMTEHIEYQPHKADIPHPDRNRAHEVALNAARESDLILVRGSEITRSMPPGHANAIFITDANKLIIDDPLEVFREAKKQGAFIFWNHPNWTSQRKDGIATLTDMHRQLIKEGLLDGIEVVNDLTYSDEALQIALDENITIMGTSDIHGLVDWQYKVPEGGHRPLTLAFAKERSEAGIKEALENGRTVAYFDNLLIGQEEYLKPLLEASLEVKSAEYQGSSTVVSVELANNSDADLMLGNLTDFTFHAHGDFLQINAHSSIILEVKTIKKLKEFELNFTVLNGILAPKKHPEITIKVSDL
jgi:hypothetical protein